MGEQAEEWKMLGVAGRNAYGVQSGVVDMRRRGRQSQTIELQAQPQNLLIDLERTALVVVDMQNDFCAVDGWLGTLGIDFAAGRALVDPINRVAKSLRARAVPIIWLNWGVRPDRLNLSPSTQHPFNPAGQGPGLAGPVATPSRSYNLLQKDSWGAQLIDGLAPEESDIRIDKHRISGFWDTPLDAVLRNLDVTTLLFAGVNADHCVLGTLMDANFHGYDTILLEDCTATTSPDFCMQATLHNVRFCFGFTATSAALTESLAGGN
ncbi:cysteine hydrolase family protein [Roseiterribacter gracilis]|uniref:Peroxyureidoacrylate/ureidoacrylate amidohydrolase RutB n=1 Tax=Roseiterribacter gracilis TaxID=2812848 RepID=A0A8S8X890_9PROT|nr:peroxyureidoacrylate/ureidoacrylate amidohydrolase RutB [Rhodospirillales bacterium TMPK1]